MKILFCEHEATGWSHARSNAGVLAAARRRFPAAELYLYASAKHFERMKASIDLRFQADLEDIHFIAMPVIERRHTHRPALMAALMATLWLYFDGTLRLWRAAAIARRHQCDVTFFLSGLGLHIRIAKLFSFAFLLRCPAVFVVHNWLPIRQPRLRSRILFPTSWSATRFPTLTPCHYLFLHGGMREIVESAIGDKLGDNFHDFHYPIMHGDSSESRQASDRPIEIAYLSPSHKGVDDFCMYVTACRDRIAQLADLPQPEFAVVGGFVRAKKDFVWQKLRNAGVARFPTDYLSEQEYADALSRATYVVHLFEPALFACRFSSAIHDTIAWRLPAVYLRNSYSDYVFSALGSPGWQVDSIDEAVDATIELLRTHDRSTYDERVHSVSLCATRCPWSRPPNSSAESFQASGWRIQHDEVNPASLRNGTRRANRIPVAEAA